MCIGVSIGSSECGQTCLHLHVLYTRRARTPSKYQQHTNLQNSFTTISARNLRKKILQTQLYIITAALQHCRGSSPTYRANRASCISRDAFVPLSTHTNSTATKATPITPAIKPSLGWMGCVVNAFTTETKSISMLLRRRKTANASPRFTTPNNNQLSETS